MPSPGNRSIDQHLRLLRRTRLPKRTQQPDHSTSVIHGGVGGRTTAEEHVDLTLSMSPWESTEQPGHSPRVEAGVGGGAAGQRAGPGRPRPTCAARPAAGHGPRVIETRRVAAARRPAR